MSVITKNVKNNEVEVFCKGAPETIVSLSKWETVPEDLVEVLHEYTDKGYRVIGLARKPLDKLAVPDRLTVESNLEFTGLIILENRLKKQTPSAIEELRRADIKIAMITGKEGADRC